jgi:hypothetical protein
MRITMVGFVLKGGKYSPQYLHRKIEAKCNTKLHAEKELKKFF